MWQSPAVMEQFSNTSPAVGAGLAVVGSNGGRYYAFDLATGELRWKYAADGIVHLAAPLIAGGRVYMAGGKESDHVHAVDAATGQAVSGWPIELPAPASDIAGTRLARQRAVSSFAAVGGLVVMTTRLDDSIDTDANGVADKYLSRELVVGIDASGAIAWKHDLGRQVTSQQNDIPKYFVCPTPAAYGSDGGTLVAATSSLSARVTVLDAVSGNERAQATLAGATLASPVLANGRLISVATDGTIEGLLSGANQAPATPGAVEDGAAAGRGRRDAAVAGGAGRGRRGAELRAADRQRRRGTDELAAADLPGRRDHLVRGDGDADAGGDVHVRGAGARRARRAVGLVGARDVHGGGSGRR